MTIFILADGALVQFCPYSNTTFDVYQRLLFFYMDSRVFFFCTNEDCNFGALIVLFSFFCQDLSTGVIVVFEIKLHTTVHWIILEMRSTSRCKEEMRTWALFGFKSNKCLLRCMMVTVFFFHFRHRLQHIWIYGKKEKILTKPWPITINILYANPWQSITTHCIYLSSITIE